MAAAKLKKKGSRRGRRRKRKTVGKYSIF
jgi:hypothetical protein